MNSRIDRLYETLEKEKLDAIIITDGYNVHYLSGYKGHCGIMLITNTKKIILTDSRYTEQVSIEASEFDCVDIGLEGYSKKIAEIFANIFENKEQLRIGFENEEISFKQYFAIKKNLDTALNNKYELVALDNKIDKLRVIKDETELSRIKKAEEIGDKAFSHILEFIKPGITEKRIALELEYTMKSLGAAGLSFDTIAASGPNSSLPHAVPTERKLQSGDFLTMDFGCIYDGYCSDMTRTVFIGDNISSEQQKVYDTVLNAQLEALKLIRPGAKCSDVDARAREIIGAEGYGDYFGHGLGHSVGLFIHEEPRCSRKCDTILEPGMMMTCEPGIYLPGKFGVRIEDLVVVTEDGYENFASSPKELIFL